MTNLRLIWLCARVNLLKWRVTPRLYMLAAVILAFCLWVFSWISDYAAVVDTPVTPWVFPFFQTMPVYFLIYGFLTILLYSDAPFTDHHTPFILIRTSRLNWTLGQLLYMVIAGFLYTLFFVLMSIVVLIPHLQFSTDWGAVLRTLAFNPASPERYNIVPLAQIGGSIMSMFKAIPAMLVSFGLFWLVSVFMGVVIFCFNLVFGRGSGLVVASVLTFISYFVVFVGRMIYTNNIYYFSPVSWSSMTNIDWGRTGSMPSSTYVITVLSGGIILMSVLSMIIFNRQDLHIIERRS